YGMSDRIGPQQLSSRSDGPPGRDHGQESAHSDQVAALIDDEVRRIVDFAHDRARFILTTHRATLDRLARALVERESLDDRDLAEVFGELDKGAGIEVPANLDRVMAGSGGSSAPIERVPGAALSEAAGPPDVRATRPSAAEWALRRLVAWWRTARSPRPTAGA